MECPHCHAMLADGAKFCPYCGNALDTAATVGSITVAPVGAPEPQPTPGYAETAPGTDGPGVSGQKKSRKKVVGVAIACVTAVAVACGGGAVYYMHQQQAKEQAAYELAHSKHALIVKVSAEGWDTSAGSSRVPVRVKGKDADGKKVNKIFYVDSQGKGISLIQGTYKIKAAGSPIAADGTVYKTPCTSAELTLDDVFSKGEKIDLADLANKDSIFSFSPIDAVDVTDDDISSAYVFASKDAGKGHADADALSQAATKRRDDAVAAKKAADEEAARKAEEERKAAARHIEAQTFSVDLPEYWDGRVTAKVDGDKITLYSTAYPDKYIGWLEGKSSKVMNAGDVGTSITKDIDLGGGRYVEIWIRRWAYDAAMGHLPKYASSAVNCSDDAAREILDLQAMGTISFDTIVSEMKSAHAPSSDTLMKADDIFANALTPSVKLR